MKKFEHQTVCPYCGEKHELASSVGHDDTVSPGDMTLCLQCGEWAVFTEDLALRQPTVDEYIEIGKDPIATAVRRAWVEVK